MYLVNIALVGHLIYNNKYYFAVIQPPQKLHELTNEWRLGAEQAIEGLSAVASLSLS